MNQSQVRIEMKALCPLALCASLYFLTCHCTAQTSSRINGSSPPKSIQLVVLGIAQDAGFPQAGCKKQCCAAAWKEPGLRRMVSSVAVIDHQSQTRYLFDCTPDFPKQLQLLEQTIAGKSNDIHGIFLTHAHIGHYTGLIHLGREVMGASGVPVYAMPRMKKFLQTNGPWSQLVKLDNIRLGDLEADKTVPLAKFSVTPFLVPHRDEFSETVGFRIQGPNKTALFIPDIDKWSRWDRSIEKLLQDVDVAYLDGTFFENGEIPGRDMSLIPHPFVAETINRLAPLDETQRKKVRFIHLNHTNPGLQKSSGAAAQIERAGMRIAVEGEVVDL